MNFDEKNLLNAVKGGNFEVFRFLVELGFEPNVWTVTTLLSFDKRTESAEMKDRKINILKFIGSHYENSLTSEWVHITAARSCNLDVLQWLHTFLAIKNVWVCANAAQNCDLEMLEWLRENGCEWDSNTFTYAVRGLSLVKEDKVDTKILDWLRDNGCPWSKETYTKSKRYKNKVV